MSSKSRSPTNTASSGATPSASSARSQIADEPRILDRLPRPGDPEERLVALAETGGDRIGPGQPVAPERREPGAVPSLDELLVVAELHQRVAPVEENGPNHACTLAAC